MARWVLWLLLMICCAPLLQGCGQIADALAYKDLATAAQDRSFRVAALSATSVVSMPDAGSVQYGGHAALSFVLSGAEVTLLGQAQVTADFVAGTLDGRAERFFGGSGIGDTQSYAGGLTIIGQIGQRRPNGVDGEINGSLVGGGSVIAVDGPLLGGFRGVGAAAMTAYSDDTLVTTLNGTAVDAGIRLTLEQ